MAPVSSKICRTPFAFVYLEDDPVARGSISRPARMVALGILTGERHALSDDEFAFLRDVSAFEWTSFDPAAAEIVETLLEKGLLLSDDADLRSTSLRRRDAELRATQWNGYAALFHYMTQWSGVGFAESGEASLDLRASARMAARALLEVHGPPPGEFAEFGPGPVVPLPGVEREGEFYRTLAARRTTRAFDAGTPMPLTQLDTVLRYVFGCHGYGRNAADVLCIKRTSPSGGGLAAVEAYAIIDGVEGVPAGIYHYNARDHCLVRKLELVAGAGRAMASEFMCGQQYFGSAHVTFVLTARFARSYWKYRRHPKAYAGLLMEAAHLVQTLYLVAAHLGLGAFVTIAVNGRDIEACLGLDGVREGVLAMAGCGLPLPSGSPLDMQFVDTARDA